MKYREKIASNIDYNSFIPYICSIITIGNACTNMNTKETAIIHGILAKDDRKRHDQALILLLYGKKKEGTSNPIKYEKKLNDPILGIPYSLQDNIRKMFSRNGFEDAYSIFATGFMVHLDSLPAQTLLGIDDLKKWMTTAGRHYALSHFEEIGQLELREGGNAITYNLSNHADTANNEAEITDGQTPLDDFSGNLEEDIETTEEALFTESRRSDEEMAGQNDEPIGDNPFDEPTDSQWRFEYYLSKVQNKEYQDLIRAIKIEGVDRETLAEEYGRDVAYINTRFNRAWNTFIMVAMEESRHLGKSLFRKYEHHQDLDNQSAELLQAFFQSKGNVKDLARQHGMTVNDTKQLLGTAFKELIKIDKEETEKANEKTHREEKMQKRMERLFKKHQVTLRKDFADTYSLLQKYFKECKGDFSAMAEWALNSNINIDQLAQKLEESFDVLNKIDKEQCDLKSNSNNENENK